MYDEIGKEEKEMEKLFDKGVGVQSEDQEFDDFP